MYKVNEIKELIRALDNSSLEELEIRGENKTKLLLKKTASSASAPVSQKQDTAQAENREEQAPAPVFEQQQEQAKDPASAEKETETKSKADTSHLGEITSPMVGTFYSAPSPEEGPYVKTGDNVKKDSIVCIVEAMKLMNELEAEIDGEIVEILVENGELVEYGQPLFLVKES
ncbi:biotin carboxyl carrier protein [Sinobaca qinghaiensis]|uniref:Biotin carboxyl carrier protein of acetyl-CoA carboxylase n=1 Tax=Sinobaca qinghaiensis TaxID=342944 RepID=A0A419V6P2_9BACL|nr:acetyl-CoA carboxylase biotin carboxyl carrier protein [Sinobaca qinghaiensis]RKD75630.1 biotin carboxyl carrier protein [Sinobaca qinghaiensis]